MAHGTWEPIAITMAVIVFGSLYVARMIEDERLDIIKAFFFLNGMISIFISGMLLIPMENVHEPQGAMTNLVLSYGTMNALFILFIIWFYGIYLFERFFDKTQKIANQRGKL